MSKKINTRGKQKLLRSQQYGTMSASKLNFTRILNKLSAALFCAPKVKFGVRQR